jgi:hypothetical protein
MGNTFSSTWVPRTPSNPHGRPKVRGYARPKGDPNPLNHGFWIDDSLKTHPAWKDMKEVPGRKRKLKKKEEEKKRDQEAFERGWKANQKMADDQKKKDEEEAAAKEAAKKEAEKGTGDLAAQPDNE